MTKALIPLHVPKNLQYIIWGQAIRQVMTYLDWKYWHTCALEEWWEEERRDLIGCYIMGGEL